MGDTVTNHELLVATKGTGHEARTEGDTDVCWNPPKLVAVPHENYVSTRNLGGGATTKTFIQDKPIVTTIGVLEPMSMPPHGDSGGGVNTGKYRFEAKMTGGSPDVTAEGNPVCRTNDPTTQNHANTTGKLVQLSKEEQLKREEEERMMRCTLVRVDGDCEHDRKLYFPPGGQKGDQGYYLEVLSTDTVILEAHRENAVEAGPPVCSKGIHTKWVIKRSGGGEEPQETERNGDILTLDPGWFDVPSIDEWGLKPGSRSKNRNYDPVKADDVTANQKKEIDDKIPVTNKEKKIRDRMAAKDPKLSQEKQNYARSRQNARDAAMSERKGKNKAAQNTIKMAMNVAMNAAKVYYFWNYMTNPVSLQITALACSGSKNFTLVCYPAGKFEFDLFSDKIAENVAKIKSIVESGKKIAEKFNAGSKRWTWEFLKDPQLLLTTEYKELKEDKNGLLKSQVNRYWDLSIGFGKLVEFGIELPMPLLNFFGPMGYVANVFLNALGIEGNAFLAILFSINPRVSGRWTEYNEPSIGLFQVTLKFEFQAGCRVRFRDIAEVYANGYLEVTFDFNEPKLAPGYLFKFKGKGTLQPGIKAGGYASWWGFSKSFEINYKPPEWKVALYENDFYIPKLS
jgi:hypothetical protein